ncbi:MAG: UDP-N-acetylglucosamine--N-acetylmuramyl-(pentapeptide) pyrophosphoryl-undecaprenol N-acetylglucosamine transferase [Deltaproteobacteria bacterium]|nr:UDP-N-acetylglucosamine--N-acetylmuramyl-(pentapeptide) pyrophosphoryl-undecaprenol N-acetylglucosamine transferase [Deltaproteobacteria bacterium]
MPPIRGPIPSAWSLPAVAGGGTGGHLFPGIAVAEEILSRNAESDVLFIGTGKPFETSVLNEKGFRHAAIAVQGLKNRGLLKQLWAFMLLPVSLAASARLLKDFNPDLVLGVGGYSAGPVVAAAWMKGIKTVLQEQNILPGITNRWLSRIAKTPSPFTILIAGGSQGAHAINLAVIGALGHLKKKERFHFIHQTGIDDKGRMKKAYADSDTGSTVKAFFTDMAQQYQTADLIICRAGATTVAEVTVLGKPVIFIPYPHAADDHQRLNAESLVQAGASEMIQQKDLDGKLLAHRIEYYADSPEKLAQMGIRASRLGRPHAARVIVDDMYALISRG